MLPRKYAPQLQNNIYERRAASAVRQLFTGASTKAPMRW